MLKDKTVRGLRNTKRKPCRQCPCGCGKALYPYNGLAVLVCPSVWRKVESKDRKTIMLPGSTLAERRASARRVLEMAYRIRDERKGTHRTNGTNSQSPIANSQEVLGKCCCGAPARGKMGDGEPRCCATCAFHPQGCRCKYGDPPDTVNDMYFHGDGFGEEGEE